ncbi:hypothetical protein GGF46_001093 [Coemansia sp. RSA 552]|nr:hypothetical protein GGF46_001093 [Coemansia sp. RSA 552]
MFTQLFLRWRAARWAARLQSRGPASARLYTGEMLKGTPRFTRLRGKKPPIDVEQKAAQSESEYARPRMFTAKNVRKLLAKGFVFSCWLASVGMTAYSTMTYYYVTMHWPVPDDIKWRLPRHFIYMSTVFDHIHPHHWIALKLLQAAEKFIVDGGKDISPDSPGMRELKLKIGRCMYLTGKLEEADKTLSDLVPRLLQARGEPCDSFDEDREYRTVEWVSPDMQLYKATAILANLYKDTGRLDEAIDMYAIGIQATRRIKDEVVSTFDNKSLPYYAAYENSKLKETLLAIGLAEVFYKKKDYQTADLLFRAIFNAVRQHNSHARTLPHFVSTPRTHKDEWICLDAYAVLYLARILVNKGDYSDAMSWIISGRKRTVTEENFDKPRCIQCEAGFINLLGHIAEAQGKMEKAEWRYREAYDQIRYNMLTDDDNLAADAERLGGIV